VPQKSQAALTRPRREATSRGVPADNETAEREIDAILARLDAAIAQEHQTVTLSGEPEGGISASLRRLASSWGFGSAGTQRKAVVPADDDAAEADIDATIARLDTGIAEAKAEMDDLLSRLRAPLQAA
jgi:hypothetical protein